MFCIKGLPATGSADLFGVHQSEGRYSCSGCLCLQWVFVPIVWLVFAMWGMPAKRLHSVAGRGVLAVGFVLAVGVYSGGLSWQLVSLQWDLYLQ